MRPDKKSFIPRLLDSQPHLPNGKDSDTSRGKGKLNRGNKTADTCPDQVVIWQSLTEHPKGSAFWLILGGIKQGSWWMSPLCLWWV